MLCYIILCFILEDRSSQSKIADRKSQLITNCTYLSDIHFIGYKNLFVLFIGHEMAFAVFLCCLYKIGVFTEADAPAVVLKLFNKSVSHFGSPVKDTCTLSIYMYIKALGSVFPISLARLYT